MKQEEKDIFLASFNIAGTFRHIYDRLTTPEELRNILMHGYLVFKCPVCGEDSFGFDGKAWCNECNTMFNLENRRSLKQ